MTAHQYDFWTFVGVLVLLFFVVVLPLIRRG